MNTKSMLENLTETFAAQGYEGNALMEIVFAAGYAMALVVKDEAAAKHFAARYAEVATK